MLEKKESTPSARSSHNFFPIVTETPPQSDWELIQSCLWSTIFFNRKKNKILGLGSKCFELGHSTELVWSVPLRDLPVKQVVAGSSHLLVLYENGTLDGYGNGNSGQLGIGCTGNRDLATVNISLPNDERPKLIAAAGYYSLVLTHHGRLYGFGDNSSGQLGLGKERTIEFPTLIPFPEGAIPARIYTADDRTIICCAKGDIYGFGKNYSNELGFHSEFETRYAQNAPKRLEHFEQLQPKEFLMGKDAVIVLSQTNEYRFYGTDRYRLTTYKSNKITVPQDAKISFSYNHLIAYSEQGDLWHVQADERDGFKKIERPKQLKPHSALAGCEASFILDDYGCYVLGNNNSNKLGLGKGCKTTEQLRFVSLTQLSYQPACLRPLDPSTIATAQQPPQDHFLMASARIYNDSTPLLAALYNHRSKVIEFNRPKNFGKTTLLGMIYAFHSPSSAVAAPYFELKAIGNNPDFIRDTHGKLPVIYLDLGRLKVDDLVASYDRLMAEVYIVYRQILFNGILKDKESRKYQYQGIATLCSNFIRTSDILLILVKHLYKQYKTPVRLLIDNADFGLHHEKSKKITEYIQEYLRPAMESVYVAQTVLMGIHPSGLISDDFDKYRDTLFQIDSPFLPFFKLHNNFLNESQLNNQFIRADHFIYKLRVNQTDCDLIKRLLNGEILDIAIKPNPFFAIDGTFIFEYLLQLGLLEIKGNKENSTYALSIPNPYAKNALQELHNQWHTQNLNRITVILDIDNVLAIVGECNEQTASFFLLKGAIFKICNLTHYVPPGVLELIRYLFANPLIKVMFFSAGNEIRNREFVRLLLEKALGMDAWDIAIDKLILSREHLSMLETFRSERQLEQYGIYKDEYKKDILKALHPHDLPSRAFITDNEPKIIFYGQEKNYLYTETATTDHFKDLANPNCPCQSPADLLFRVVNAPFRIAGFIQDCFTQRHEESVTSRLFALQFSPKTGTQDSDSVTYEPVWSKAPRGQYYYRSGLNLLKLFNSELQFITPEVFKATLLTSLSQAEVAAIEDAQEHQQSGNCRIM